MIILVAASYCTSIPRDSVTNRKGSMVRPPVITGSTRGLAESIGRAWPFSDACAFPIQRSNVFFARVTVTFRVVGSHDTLPPNASMTARIGTSVRPSVITGFVPWASIAVLVPLMVIVGFPIHNLTTVAVEALAICGVQMLSNNSQTTIKRACRSTVIEPS